MAEELSQGERLKSQLAGLAKRRGADLFGVADLTPAKPYIEETFGEELLHFPRAVVMALFYPVGIVNQLAEGPTHTYLYYYKVLNTRLDDMALETAVLLEHQGYDAFPIPASQRVTEDKLAGIFSHRLAASLAGLGWIGRSCALISPQVGPRLRLVTVLTDAPLPPDRPMEVRCGTCQACVEACPAKAIQGALFKGEDPLDARLNAGKCDEYLSKVRVAFGKRVCGRCLAVCPWGKKRRHGAEHASDGQEQGGCQFFEQCNGTQANTR